MWRKRVGIGLALAVLVSVAGCSSSARSAPAARSGSVIRPVAHVHGLYVALPASSKTIVSAHTAPASAAMSINAALTTAVGSEPSPLQLVAGPWLFTASGPLPAAGVALTVHVDRPTAPGSQPFLATYDPTTGTWIPVASTYSSTKGTVQATVPHFSIWGVLRFVTSGVAAIVMGVTASLVGSVKFSGPTPVCSPTSTVKADYTPNDGTLNVCAQASGASDVTAKVASTLAFPTDLLVGGSPSIALVPATNIYDNIDKALFDATKGRWNGTVIPAGSEADVTVPLAAGQSTNFLSELDDTAYLVGVLESAVQVLLAAEAKLGATAAKETVAEIGQGTCVADLMAASPTQQLDAAALKDLAQVAFDCAQQIVDLGTVAVLAAVIGVVAGIFEDIVQTAFLAVETTVGWSTGGDHKVTLVRAATPNSTTNAPTGGTASEQVLPPATTPPVVGECSLALSQTADGQKYPLFCQDGGINVPAWQYYATSDPDVLALGPGATEPQVLQAMCNDLSQYPGTNPITADAEQLAARYNGWAFGQDPLLANFDGTCQ